MKLPAAALLLLPAAAVAHPGRDHVHAGEAAPFLLGLAHPLLGLDHLLAMLAVGLWAAMLGGRAVWALPAAFVAAMAVGGGLGSAGMALPGVEPVILASVILLGAALALTLRPPPGASVLMVTLFAIAHGAAHGLEGPATGLLVYGTGFILATGGLLLVGLGVGMLLARAGRVAEPRLLGLGATAAGVVLVWA